MPEIYDWIDTEGGPFLLIPEDLLAFWRGTEGWSFETHGADESDYSRASDIFDYVAPLKCGEGTAYVLAGDVGPISWISTEDTKGGYLVTWIGVDDESQIMPALQSEEFKELISGESVEQMRLDIPEPGQLRVIQAADIGDNLVAPSLSFELQPGTYNVTSVYFETTSLMIAVRRLELQ